MLIDVVMISPIFRKPREGPIVNAFTVNEEINAIFADKLLVLTLHAVSKPVLNNVVLKTGGKLLIPTPVNPDPSPVNLPLKLPKPAVVENVDI